MNRTTFRLAVGGAVTGALALGSVAAATAWPAQAEPTGWSVRSTATDHDIIDPLGRRWKSDLGLVGAQGYSNTFEGWDIKGTTNDIIYRANHYGVTGYRFDVPAAGTYKVRLMMADDYATKAGERVFNVDAEGSRKLSNVDIAGSAGYDAAYIRTFTVAVTDGTLNIDFGVVVEKPLISAVEVTYVSDASDGRPGSTPVPISTPEPATPAAAAPAANSGRIVKFSPESFWTQDISSAPLSSNTAAQASSLSKQVADWYGGIAAFNAFDYNNSFYAVPAGQRRVDVEFWDCQGKGHIPENIYSGKAYFKQVPIPDGAIPAKGTDNALSIYDPAADQLWEFWLASYSSGKWKACWGGRIDNVSQNQGIFQNGYGATATNLADSGGMITLADVERGYINHALSLAIIDPAPGSQVSWPAQRSDGSSTGGPIPEGNRLRLDPSLDLSRYNLTPLGLMVAKAAQKYGFVVTNKAGAVSVVTQSGDQIAKETGVNPWDTILNGLPPYLVMRNFPWDKTQFLPRDYGKP